MPVAFSRYKAVALLAFLAVQRQRHERAALAALLWPEREPARGLASLRTALWEISQAFGEQMLSVERGSVALEPSQVQRVDIHRFEQLLSCPANVQELLSEEQLTAFIEATHLYRGELMQGALPKGCVEFDHWHAACAERLRAQLAGALKRVVETYVARGAFPEAMPFARRRVALEPFNEEAHRMLMRLHAWRGQRAEALRQYELCAATLAAELDTRPEEQTRLLHEALLAGNLMSPPSGAGPLKVGLAPGAGSHLPAVVTPFVGREAELELLHQRLSDPACRMLTLTGPGGVGKTRLALEFARRQQAAFPGGVHFISLSTVPEAGMLWTALAAGLGLPCEEAVAAQAYVLEFLRPQTALFVLDGAEHWSRAASPLTVLLASAPQVRLLITSRERLVLQGEWELILDGFPCPAEALQPSDAVSALFTNAARRAWNAFCLREEDAAGLLRICRRVEGMPLGLEMAAAWLRHFSLEEIAAQLEQSLDLLEGPSDAPERQRSLRASFLHSWRLLTAPEQEVLRRLAVFSGGATAQAVEQVSGASLTVLASLVDKFLVNRVANGRYELPALIRQYAMAQLLAHAEDEREAWRRHIRLYLGMLRDVPLESCTPQHERWWSAAMAERENVRAAARRAVATEEWELMAEALAGYLALQERLEQVESCEAFLRDSIAALRGSPRPSLLLLCRLLIARAHLLLELGRLPLAAKLVSAALEQVRSLHAPQELEAALVTAGRLAMLQGHGSAARWSFRAALASSSARADGRGVASAMSWLSEVARREGQFGRARRLLARALSHLRALNAPAAVAVALGTQGDLLRLEGRRNESSVCYSEAVQAAREAGQPRILALLLGKLGYALVLNGDVAQGRRDLEASRRLARALGLAEALAEALYGLGRAALLLGELADARVLLEESLGLCRQRGALHGVAAALNALGECARAQGALGQADAAWRAALESASEAAALPLALEALLRMAELRGVSDPESPLRPALEQVYRHPCASYETRSQAGQMLGLSGLAPSTQPRDAPSLAMLVIPFLTVPPRR